MSSICLETLAIGVPVIVVDDTSGLRYDPIPEAITEDIWRVCYTAKQLVEAIGFYKSCTTEQLSDYRKIGDRIVNSEL